MVDPVDNYGNALFSKSGSLPPMEQHEKEIYHLHKEITVAFEESTRTHNVDWLKCFWEIMMEESNLSKQQLIDLMLDEFNRGNTISKEMLQSILENS